MRFSMVLRSCSMFCLAGASRSALDRNGDTIDPCSSALVLMPLMVQLPEVVAEPALVCGRAAQCAGAYRVVGIPDQVGRARVDAVAATTATNQVLEVLVAEQRIDRVAEALRRVAQDGVLRARLA